MNIYYDDVDRARFLEILGQVVEQFDLVCHTYCLMSNHYHAVLQPCDGSLSEAMRQLNGVYAQWWNRRHGRVGHMFQGRFKAQLVQDDYYFLEVCRYVVLNPVRAALVSHPREWPWSSFAAIEGTAPCPDLLTVERIRSYFRRRVRKQSYAEFVEAGIAGSSVGDAIRRDVRVIGDETFVARFKPHTEHAHQTEVPSRERNIGRKTLTDLFAGVKDTRDRNLRICAARRRHGYKLTEIADHLGLHYSAITKILARWPAAAARDRLR